MQKACPNSIDFTLNGTTQRVIKINCLFYEPRTMEDCRLFSRRSEDDFQQIFGVLLLQMSRSSTFPTVFSVIITWNRSKLAAILLFCTHTFLYIGIWATTFCILGCGSPLFCVLGLTQRHLWTTPACFWLSRLKVINYMRNRFLKGIGFWREPILMRNLFSRKKTPYWIPPNINSIL